MTSVNDHTAPELECLARRCQSSRRLALGLAVIILALGTPLALFLRAMWVSSVDPDVIPFASWENPLPATSGVASITASLETMPPIAPFRLPDEYAAKLLEALTPAQRGASRWKFSYPKAPGLLVLHCRDGRSIHVTLYRTPAALGAFVVNGVYFRARSPADVEPAIRDAYTIATRAASGMVTPAKRGESRSP